MKRFVIVGLAIALVIFGWVILWPYFNLFVFRYQSPECKQRGAAYHARAEKLERDAAEVLKIGATKQVVTRFFQDNGIPVTFYADEATGTISLKGCAGVGCGSDDALLGVRVKVDKTGAVTSEPQVGAIYTDCL